MKERLAGPLLATDGEHLISHRQVAFRSETLANQSLGPVLEDVLPQSASGTKQSSLSPGRKLESPVVDSVAG